MIRPLVRVSRLGIDNHTGPLPATEITVFRTQAVSPVGVEDLLESLGVVGDRAAGGDAEH